MGSWKSELLGPALLSRTRIRKLAFSFAKWDAILTIELCTATKHWFVCSPLKAFSTEKLLGRTWFAATFIGVVLRALL